jgi:hypothetical protein
MQQVERSTETSVGEAQIQSGLIGLHSRFRLAAYYKKSLSSASSGENKLLSC